ncbi:ROK family transcriptional regulator [uncultured Dubosiella sp.]|uniref:ROK family transcriptional regulator n=1 Tax=uncultured Dubosiella sp. TaxID=1937011 RepID=UPI0025987026|nr:ROK family protein [uncultured Dubosiella sp.]
MNQWIETRNLFYDKNTWTKTELARESALSLAGLTKHLTKLLEHGDIVCPGVAGSTGGRPSKRYVLNPDRSHILCVMLQKQALECLSYRILALDGSVVKEERVESGQITLDFLLECIGRACLRDPLVDLVVLSFPGVCSHGVLEVGDLKQLLGVDLKAAIEARFSVECRIENDVNCACIGYARARRCANVAFLFLPENASVGCGLVLNGQLYNGHRHFAGELRYLPFEPRSIDRFVETLACVVAPAVIAIFDETCARAAIHWQTVPLSYRPCLDWVPDMAPFVWDGLFTIAIDALKKRTMERKEDL